VNLRNRITSSEQNKQMGIQCVADVVRLRRLKWFCHVDCTGQNYWVSACRNVFVTVAKVKGRGKKTWEDCI